MWRCSIVQQYTLASNIGLDFRFHLSEEPPVVNLVGRICEHEADFAFDCVGHCAVDCDSEALFVTSMNVDVVSAVN